MFKKQFSSFVVLLSLLLVSCQSIGQNDTKQKSSTTATIEVIQFHLEHRCVTCLKIEKLARGTLTGNLSSIPFRLVNVEEKQNEKLASDFEATGSALFLFNPKTGKKKNLTQFAFLTAGDDAKFQAELKKHIEEFIKS
jgi:hypothetical protein